MAINQDAIDNEVEQDESQQQENEVKQTGRTVADENHDVYEALAEKAEKARQEREGVTDEGQEQSVETQIDSQVEAATAPQETLIKVKLDGVEQEVPLSDVVRAYQKDAVASKRLNDASAKLREADEILARAKAQPTQENSSQVGEDATNIAKTAIESLLNGDEEGAANALALLAAGRGNSTQAPDTDEVAAKVKQQLEVDSALTKFTGEYADVVSDPQLAKITNDFLAEEMNTGTHATQYEALVAAGNRARSWLADKTGVKTGDESSTIRNDRVAKKAGMEQVPSNSASAASQDEPTESASDIIAEMKKARGLIA
jgi:hypothetical protein